MGLLSVLLKCKQLGYSVDGHSVGNDGHSTGNDGHSTDWPTVLFLCNSKCDSWARMLACLIHVQGSVLASYGTYLGRWFKLHCVQTSSKSHFCYF